MVHGKENKPQKVDEIDQWLENFFLDPLTSFLDEVAFRIDLFETAEEYIAEAQLPAYQLEEIELNLERNKMRIQVQKGTFEKDIRQRIIPFPFQVAEHEVTATFHDGVLEIYIAKNKLCEGMNRKIPITK